MRRLGLWFTALALVVMAALWLPRAMVGDAPVQRLARALQIPDVMLILRDEGLSSAAKMFPASADEAKVWQAKVGDIYDPAAMEAAFLATLETDLAASPSVVAQAQEFFGSDLGQLAMRLELEARRALQDDDVQSAAQAAYAELWRDNPQRQVQLDQFVAVNDLIESNITGALNANLAFLRGVAQASGDAMGLSDADMTAQVWAGEAEVRIETQKWLFAYLNLAYQPLSDAELQAYIDFSASPSGQKLNTALFRAYDVMFDRLSHELGQAYARHALAQET